MENEPDPLASAPRRVEAYLDQILAPLTRRLSPFHQDELRRELREHLWARIEAYRELDHSEDEAVTEALRQFGGAEDFLRQWRREWTKSPQKITLREVWEAARSAFRPSLSGIAGACLPFILIHVLYLNLHGSPIGALLYGARDVLFWVLVGFSFLLLPALVGARQGRRTPKRAGIGMLAALTTEFLVAGLLYEVAVWTLPGGVWTSPLGADVQMDSGSLFGVMATWIPVAGGAAALRGWWMQRSQALRLA